MDLAYIESIAMQVITYSGMSKSSYLQALEQYKSKQFEKGNDLLIQGDESAILAHKTHYALLQKEMQEEQAQVSLLLMHAEDQLMNAETIRILVEELKYIYEKGETNNGK